MELLKQHALSFASQIHGPNYHKQGSIFLLHKKGNISSWSCLDHFGLPGLLRSSSVHLIYFVHFGPIWSILVQFSLLQSILSTSVQFCIFSQFYPLQSIWSNSVYLLKNGKRQVLVESTINYLSNINCNYRISFGYHNNLKKMRN